MKKGKNVGSTETKLHLENIIKCLICQIGWANDQDVPEIQANNQMEFTCQNCDKKFDKNTDLEEHVLWLVRTHSPGQNMSRRSTKTQTYKSANVLMLVRTYSPAQTVTKIWQKSFCILRRFEYV